MKNKDTDKTFEYEYLALVINYPELLARNTLKEEFFKGQDRILFTALLKEYSEHKAILIENLLKYNGLDINYYFQLQTDNLWNSNKDKMFEELQKSIIDKYKQYKFKEITDSYSGNYEETIQRLEDLLNINYQEISYIQSNDILESLSNNKRHIALGYPGLDRNLNLSRNDLLIIGAGSGTGKTAYALNLLVNLAKDYQCIYFNMEMSKDILYKRLIAIKTGIMLNQLNEYKNLNQKDLQRVVIASEELQNIILINGSTSIPYIKKNILNIKTDKHIIVFLDHIGLIKSPGNSLYERITNTAKELRTLGLDCNCTVIGLCQLSRESQRNNQIPTMQDLRDSGEIEQSARKIILLYDEDKKNPAQAHNMKIIIAKNDDGNRTIKDYEFDRYTQKFKEK